jgi:hypothetical protein
MDFKVGDKCFFGRPNGEQTLGEVIKVNPRKYKIRQLEERFGDGSKRRPIGTTWTVPGEFLTAAVDAEGKLLPKPFPGMRPSLPADRAHFGQAQFRTGDSIQFNGKGRLVKGIVSKVNRSTYSVVVPGEPRGWKVPFEMASAAA